MGQYTRITRVNPSSWSNHCRYSTRPYINPFQKLKRSLPAQSNFTTIRSHCQSDTEHPRIKYNWIDGAENLEKYKPGGYHPILIGDVLHNRYRIVDKLGFGGYSTVWLAQDTHQQEYVAIKIGVSESRSLSQELKCLRALSAPSEPVHPGREAIPVPLDEFELRGPNGVHPCYTMTPARCDLREVSYSHLFPLDVARALVGGLTRAISYKHSCGYVHGG